MWSVHSTAATQPLATSVQVCEPCLDTEGCGEMRCQRNVIVVCSTVAQVQTSTSVTITTTLPLLQTVAITERKQMCWVGGARRLTTTKICFTYPDASWVCRQPGTAPQHCDR